MQLFFRPLAYYREREWESEREKQKEGEGEGERESESVHLSQPWAERPVTMEEGSEMCSVNDFEDGGRWPWVEGCRQHLEAGKGKEIDPPLEPPEKITDLPTPWLYPSETCVRFLTFWTVR